MSSPFVSGGSRTPLHDGIDRCDQVLLGDDDIGKGAVHGAADVFEAGEAWSERRRKVVFEVGGKERVDGVNIVLVFEDAGEGADCLSVVFDGIHGGALFIAESKVSQGFR